MKTLPLTGKNKTKILFIITTIQHTLSVLNGIIWLNELKSLVTEVSFCISSHFFFVNLKLLLKISNFQSIFTNLNFPYRWFVFPLFQTIKRYLVVSVCMILASLVHVVLFIVALISVSLTSHELWTFQHVCSQFACPFYYTLIQIACLFLNLYYLYFFIINLHVVYYIWI